MKVRWSSDARQDRRAVFDYLFARNPAAAIDMDDLFVDVSTRLAKFPYSGHHGKLPGTREILPHEHYRMVYQVEGDTVWIVALMHTAQQWPPVT